MTIIAVQKMLNTPEGKILFDMNLSIKDGDLVALYGESGAGKTSTLRMIAGLFAPEKGQVIVNQATWLDTDKKICLTPQQRKIGFVFQDYTLFPNMTVRGNLLFALEKGQKEDIIEELIEITELGELQHRMPSTLSGGQQQRVALARALVRKPSLLLLDEPFSALDNKIRVKLQDYILKLHKQYKLTTILVSHNIQEILKMANQVFMLDKGKIMQEGTPQQLLTNTSTSNQLRLKGKIIDIQKENGMHIVHILIGTNKVKISIASEKSAAFAIGDDIWLNGETLNLSIAQISTTNPS